MSLATASRLAIAGVIAVGLALAAVAPAQAAVPSATILSAVLADPTSENSTFDVHGACEAAAVNAHVAYTNVTTGDPGYYFENLDANKEFFFSEDPQSNMGDLGDVISITVVCVDAADATLSTSAPAQLTIPDFGASISVADSYLDESLTVSGSCGTATNVSRVAVGIFSIVGTNQVLIADEVRPISSSDFTLTGFPTGASAGASAGGTVAVMQCEREVSPGQFEAVTSYRQAEFQLLERPAPALAATGTDATTPALAGLALLLLGAIALVARRRTT